MRSSSLILLMALLAGLSGQAAAHDCVAETDEISLHFQQLSLSRALQVIAGYADRDLILETRRDREVPLHYNCEAWQDIIRDLNDRYDFAITLTDDAIVMGDR